MTSLLNPPKLRALFRSPLLMVLIALFLRVGAVAYVSHYHTPSSHAEAGLGGEIGRIARSLAVGEGFSSPFHVRTGPTAWVAPVYPYMVAGVFQVFGVYSNSSALVVRLLNSLFSSLTCLTIFLIAQRIFGISVAAWAGWAWVFFPFSIWWSVLVWETSLSTLLLTLLLLLTLRLSEKGNMTLWAVFGLLWGFTGLTKPALLSLFPFFLGWLFFRVRKHTPNSHRLVLVTSLLFVFTLFPWLLRNYLAFEKLIPLRADGPFALYLGNNEVATGWPTYSLHPWQNSNELAKFRQLGESAYLEEKQSLALRFISDHPRAFVRLTVTRIAYFWIGRWDLIRAGGISGMVYFALYALFYSLVSLLALGGFAAAVRSRESGVFLLATAMIVLPLPYYITHASVRYRHPVEPVLVILGVLFLTRLYPRLLSPRRLTSAISLRGDP